MPRHSSRLVLIVGLTIAASPLLATPRHPTVTPRAPLVEQAPGQPLAGLWQHLTRLWGALGCGLDPNGVRCAADNTATLLPTITASTPADLGCGADPDGHP
jgi:hypothetical protein